MPPDFLERVDNEYIETMRKSILRFLHSQGKLIALVSDNIVVERPKKYPEHVRSNFWCPINYRTPVEAGKSIVWRQEVYKHYLERMTKWSFYLTIPNTSLTDEI